MPRPKSPSSPAPDAIDRREALRRAALLLGGVISAPVVTGLLAGCDVRRVSNDAWRPRALSPDQAELVATIAEHILPETDTPGARAVGVHQFIDAMLADGYAEPDRLRFVAALTDVGDRLKGRSAAEQVAVLTELDRAAFPFFREFKELTLVGYYTSEVGATRELRHVVIPGRFEGCVPTGRTWAV